MDSSLSHTFGCMDTSILSTVLQGTPIRKRQDSDQFPRLQRARLRRHKQLSQVSRTPSEFSLDHGVENDQESLIIKTLYQVPKPLCETLGERRRVRDREVREQALCSSSVLLGESKTPAARMQLSCELPASEVLLAQKVHMKSHFRYKSQTQFTDDPPKPLYRPKRPLKLFSELKPNTAQLAQIYVQLNWELASAIQDSNGTTPRCMESGYKCYIGPGNNSILVLHLLRKRWFWTKVEDWEQADFIWTQNKQQGVVDTLPVCTDTLARTTSLHLRSFNITKKITRLMTDFERKKSGLGLILDSPNLVSLESGKHSVPKQIYNRLERNSQLTSKKRLYLNMRDYCSRQNLNVFDYLPVTFHIENGHRDPEYLRFLASFQTFSQQKDEQRCCNMWIIKPGEGTNCGHGIHVTTDLTEIKEYIADRFSSSGRRRTYIIQKYIERPLLVYKRKFDIRCYGLITAFNSHTQGYFYHDGYLRTSSKEFSLRNSNKFVHLTNDAVQKKSEDYGKFEHGNKLSYPEFQKYLETNHSNVDFYRDLWPQIRRLVTISYEATAPVLDPMHRKHCFEVLGYDFMVDEQFKVWLIEVNTNPCLALSSAYLARLIPAMLDNAFRIVVDSHFPEPEGRRRTSEWTSQPFVNKFELVYSSFLQSPGVPGPLSPASEEESETGGN